MVKCAKCGEEITGGWNRVGTLYYHLDERICEQNLKKKQTQQKTIKTKTTKKSTRTKKRRKR